MNRMMHEVTEFKGFAPAKTQGPGCAFLENVLQGSEVNGASGNFRAVRVPRMFVESNGKGQFITEDYQEPEREALSRFEWEGGRSAKSSVDVCP
jgi:hypothetical protein